MDYEKKYEQALSRARQFSENPLLEDSAGIVEYIFPELASEDERIRKEMIEVIRKEAKEFPSSIIAENASSWIAWLEKQGETTSTEDFGEFINILSKQFPEVSFAKLSRIAVRVKKWLEKQASPVLSNSSNVGKNEQKPAWSEEDEKMRTSCVACIGSNYHEGLMTRKEYEHTRDWLASLKGRVQPKPSWSEEDEVRINRIVACLENLNVADNDILLKDISWLKSLKERGQKNNNIKVIKK